MATKIRPVFVAVFVLALLVVFGSLIVAFIYLVRNWRD